MSHFRTFYNEDQWDLESPALNSAPQHTQIFEPVKVAVKKYSNKGVEYSNFTTKSYLISHSIHPIKVLAGASTLKNTYTSASWSHVIVCNECQLDVRTKVLYLKVVVYLRH